MMTLGELHYLIAAMCMGLFFTLGICTLFNNGWRYPYRWYVAILFYAALTFVVNTPFFDARCVGLKCLARDLFTIGIAPLAMLAVSKFIHMKRLLTLLTQSLVWVGIVGTAMSFYSLVPAAVGIAAYGAMAVALALWCVASRRHFPHLPFFVAAVVLGAYAIRLFLPFLHIEKLVLSIEAVTFLPMLLFFRFRHGDTYSLKIPAES